MSCAERPAVQAVWRSVSEKQAPLAAAVATAAAGQEGSSTLSHEQSTALVDVADDVEQAVGRCAV